MRELPRTAENFKIEIFEARFFPNSLRLADVDGRRGTEDTVVAASGFTRQATAVSCVLKKRVISFQWKRVFVGKVKEQMKPLPLEVVKVPRWRVIFSYVKSEDIPRTREKGRDLCKPKRRRRKEEQ